jgi:hypothetical protein
MAALFGDVTVGRIADTTLPLGRPTSGGPTFK